MVRWPVVVALLALRALLLASPGYIHPDEFCQGPEVVHGRLPWEFEPRHAVRSAAFPLVLWRPHWLPVWFAPRVLPFLLSLLVDWSVWRARPSAWPLLASSWPMLLLQSRSFSNGIEAVALAVLHILCALFCATASTGGPHANMRAAIALAIGAICAAGLFVRFTFPAFAAPPLLSLLWYTWHQSSPTSVSRRRAKTASGVLRVALAMMAIGASVTGAAFVTFDTLYYNNNNNNNNSIIITPFNALRYNMDPANLARHGLHARYLHALVNLPLLIGPILVWRARPALSWVVPLALLSLAPHQEPRFLLPLVAPLVIGADVSAVRPWQWVIHGVYHGACVALFGYAHQAGIVRSVRALRPPTAVDEQIGDNKNNVNGELTVAYYRTYPPPTHLAARGVRFVFSQDESPPKTEWDLLRRFGNATVVVSAVALPAGSFVRGRCWGPHVSLEDLPHTLADAQLCEYIVRS